MVVYSEELWVIVRDERLRASAKVHCLIGGEISHPVRFAIMVVPGPDSEEVGLISGLEIDAGAVAHSWVACGV